MSSTDSPAVPLPLQCLDAGDVIDERYRIDGVHAFGGMSAIYRATHLLLARPVALKVVSSELVGLPGAAERFLLEARATTLLKNAHVVQMFDVGVLPNGAPYLVMEWLEGQDLAGVIANQAEIPIETAIDYILQACEALAEVHGCGIVHRDLKPSNLFLTQAPDGSPRLKLLDFGVSKVAFNEDTPRITQTGAVVGSPSYMSPEQMGQAADVDSRSDVWGLGVVLYELLTKRVPFEGAGLSEILSAILLQPLVMASTYRKEISPELDEVLARCLQFEPSARFASVADVAAAIAPFGPPGSTEYAVAIAKLSDAAHHRELDQKVADVNEVLVHRSSVTPMGIELEITREQPMPMIRPKNRRIRVRAAFIAAAIVTVALSVPAAVTHGPHMFRSHAALTTTQAATPDRRVNATTRIAPADIKAPENKITNAPTAPPPVIDVPATISTMMAPAPTEHVHEEAPHPRRAASHHAPPEIHASTIAPQIAEISAPSPIVNRSIPVASISASNDSPFEERK